VRGLALVGTIVAFIFVATEQTNIEKIVPEAKFGTFWQQILMLIALGLSLLMTIIGLALGAMQLSAEEHSQTPHVILLVGDSIVALALGAASIAAVSVGKNKYFFLRQGMLAMFTMFAFLLAMVLDAAQAFGRNEDESPQQQQSSYKPAYKPQQNTNANIPMAAVASPVVTADPASSKRREAPAPPREFSKPRPKSTRGEVLTALYDYQGQEADELSFEEGARIELIEDHMDGWATGILLSTRAEGLFPLNYTEKE